MVRAGRPPCILTSGKAHSTKQHPAASSLYNLLHLVERYPAPMTETPSRFGFSAFAETWNGRLAMLGFVIGVATELLTGQGILSQIGLG